MGDNLISGKFVSTNTINIENLKVLISSKIVVKQFISTTDYHPKPVFQISSKLGKITEHQYPLSKIRISF
jgi:hypothetical protein